MRAVSVLVLLAGVLAGCAHLPLDCPPGTSARRVAELVFGRNIGGRLGVSEADWQRFVDSEVTPRFPSGFTVTDGRGQYRDSSGRIIREPSKVLTIALSNEEERGRLGQIAEAYRRRFSQESVLTILRPACIAF
jgi:hypothetical protein